MGKRVLITTTCDVCGFTELAEENTRGSSGARWIREYGNNMFFHSEDCYKAWLRKQGRLSDLKKFEESIWVG